MVASVERVWAWMFAFEVRHDAVDVAEHAGNVPVHVGDAVRAVRLRAFVSRVRKVHGARRLAPAFTNFSTLVATSLPMAPWASAVDPPTCGVRITFCSPWRARDEAVGVGLGLFGVHVDRGTRRAGRSCRASRQGGDVHHASRGWR